MFNFSSRWNTILKKLLITSMLGLISGETMAYVLSSSFDSLIFIPVLLTSTLLFELSEKEVIKFLDTALAPLILWVLLSLFFGHIAEKTFWFKASVFFTYTGIWAVMLIIGLISVKRLSKSAK